MQDLQNQPTTSPVVTQGLHPGRDEANLLQLVSAQQADVCASSLILRLGVKIEVVP